MPITAADWYDPDPDLKSLYQGDVLDGFPLVYTQSKDLRWVLLRPLPQGPIEGARAGLPRKFIAKAEGELPTAWNRPEGELVMAAAAVYRVMILSRSCNLDWKKQVQVAPIAMAEGLGQDVLQYLRENDNADSFYLPADGPDLPESYANLALKTTVPMSYLRRTDHLVRRLTTRATVELQNVLSEYYARPFGFDVKDEIPQNAIYRCANCFFQGNEAVPLTEINVGGNFPPCPNCGNEALWVKVS
jgi:hypothetical protein